MPTSSRAILALSVVKYVNDVPFRPARLKPASDQSGRLTTLEVTDTYASTTNPVDVVLTVIREVVVL
jgi:hypothetical protein